MKYLVTVEETLAKNFHIEADSPEEAEQIARMHYEQAEDDYVLDANDYVQTDFYVGVG